MVTSMVSNGGFSKGWAFKIVCNAPSVINANVRTGDYILGYMLNPSYFDEVKEWHKKNPIQMLELFWDKNNVADVEVIDESLIMNKINDDRFIDAMAGCKGYITTAGFESICEALYLGKPIIMIPAHIEQEINAKDAMSVGAGLISKRYDVSKLLDFIPNYSANNIAFRKWVKQGEDIFVRHLTTLV